MMAYTTSAVAIWNNRLTSIRDVPANVSNAQIAAVHWRLGERIMSTLCFPSKSAHSTGGKREKAVFD
jgi:hypothetical protein